MGMLYHTLVSCGAGKGAPCNPNPILLSESPGSCTSLPMRGFRASQQRLQHQHPLLCSLGAELAMQVVTAGYLYLCLKLEER